VSTATILSAPAGGGFWSNNASSIGALPARSFVQQQNRRRVGMDRRRHVRAGLGGEDAEGPMFAHVGHVRGAAVTLHSLQMPAKNIRGRLSPWANQVQMDLGPWLLSGSAKLVKGTKQRYSGLVR
jgi:hypothetical protein